MSRNIEQTDAPRPSQTGSKEADFGFCWNKQTNAEHALAKSGQPSRNEASDAHNLLCGFTIDYSGDASRPPALKDVAKVAGAPEKPVAAEHLPAQTSLRQDAGNNEVPKLLREDDQQRAQAGFEKLLQDPNKRIDQVDPAKLLEPKSRVLAIGDVHTTDDIKQFVEQSLPALKAAGVKLFGSEFLPQHMQADVDRYSQLLLQEKRASSAGKEVPGSSKELRELRDKIKDAFKADTEDKDKDRFPKRMMQILDKAAGSGMRVICMEPNIEHPFHAESGYELMKNAMQALAPEQKEAFQKFTGAGSTDSQRQSAQTSLRAALSKCWTKDRVDQAITTLDQARAAGLDFSHFSIPPEPEDLASLNGEKLKLRNESMAQTITKALAQSDGQMVVLTGAGHFGDSHTESAGEPAGKQPASTDSVPTVNELLKERQISSTVVAFASKPSPWGEKSGIVRGYNMNAINAAAQAVGLQKERFALKVDGEHRQADYIIHLEQ